MKDVTIVGAGAAGIRAAVELDNRNVNVLLIEKNFYIGGKLTELSRIYPVCELYFAPRFFFQLNDSVNADMMTGSEIKEIRKTEDTYTIQIKKSPRYVTEKCTLCLECVKACTKKAVHNPPFQSVPQIVYIDREKCGDCRLCEEVCPEGAVNLDEKEEITEIETQNILYSVGAQLFDASTYSEYGYNRFPDVITSIELEKMLHPSFETKGELLRPSDGKRPGSIAFLQCVGSRDTVKGEPYCSRICCMQALNEAKVIKERYPDASVTIFFTDLQCSGKGWEQFCEKTKKMGVDVIRYRVPAVYEENGTVYIEYAEDHLVTKQVDMVVLSVGISPHNEFGLPVNEFGFPVSDNACGFFLNPADITQSVQEALAAVSGISGRGYNKSFAGAPEPGLQIFLCDCGDDFHVIAEDLRKEGYTVFVSDALCTDEGISAFCENLKKEKVVVAACSLHEHLFQRLAREKGTHFVEVVPLREIKWVGKEKCEPLIKMAIAKLEHLDTSMKWSQIEIVPEAVVIGGGVSGLTAALELADTYKVYIVEKSSTLGGRAQKIQYSLNYNPRLIVKDLIEKVETHSNITILTETEVTDLKGQCGNFLLKTNRNEINCGAIIVAVGADEFNHEYMHPNIITQTELEERISTGDIPDLIVMIQCVGSRNDENPWCSSICCSKAVCNSLHILEQGDAEIIILYRDMRTSGFTDVYYRKAREKGVLFLQNDEMPSIEVKGETVLVNYVDPIVNAKMNIEPDLVVLSTGVVPQKESFNLAEILGISVDKTGFFRGIHPKFYPIDSTREGIFLCGQCHSPQNVPESIIQAKAAASRVKTFFSPKFIETFDKVTIKEEVCSGCATCVKVCPFRAISLKLKNGRSIARIDMSICKDCGLCVGCCPVSALSQSLLSDEQLLSMVEVL
ncbi:MAG: hypothetical protein AYK19_05070 [Theionarchaea archaeon DG-70-1]|nr:MAG: hypothetical protein AYK19_05070 [Theionarchaea archaeon DG-70-1]